MPHRPLVALLLPLLVLTLPAHAQQADTSATDMSATDTTEAAPPAVDTARTASTDTAAADTAMTDTATADTAQAATAPDTLAADTLSAADTAAVDTALSAEARRERAEERAQAAAEAWLSLTDDGQFGESWDEAAASLQSSVSRKVWQERGAQARDSLRSLTDRTLTRTEYRDSTARLPGGTPVVALQYRTEFEGQTALEAVITTKEDAGWKVAGYRAVPIPADSAQAPSDSVRAPDSTQARPEPDSTQDAPEPDSTQGR